MFWVQRFDNVAARTFTAFRLLPDDTVEELVPETELPDWRADVTTDGLVFNDGGRAFVLSEDGIANLGGGEMQGTADHGAIVRSCNAAAVCSLEWRSLAGGTASSLPPSMQTESRVESRFFIGANSTDRLAVVNYEDPEQVTVEIWERDREVMEFVVPGFIESIDWASGGRWLIVSSLEVGVFMTDVDTQEIFNVLQPVQQGLPAPTTLTVVATADL